MQEFPPPPTTCDGSVKWSRAQVAKFTNSDGRAGHANKHIDVLNDSADGLQKSCNGRVASFAGTVAALDGSSVALATRRASTWGRRGDSKDGERREDSELREHCEFDCVVVELCSL